MFPKAKTVCIRQSVAETCNRYADSNDNSGVIVGAIVGAAAAVALAAGTYSYRDNIKQKCACGCCSQCGQKSDEENGVADNRDHKYHLAESKVHSSERAEVGVNTLGLAADASGTSHTPLSLSPR